MDESPQGARQGNGDDFRSSIGRGRERGSSEGRRNEKAEDEVLRADGNGSGRRDSWQQRGRQQ